MNSIQYSGKNLLNHLSLDNISINLPCNKCLNFWMEHLERFEALKVKEIIFLDEHCGNLPFLEW